jgi:hypothetical protein
MMSGVVALRSKGSHESALASSSGQGNPLARISVIKLSRSWVVMGVIP